MWDLQKYSLKCEPPKRIISLSGKIIQDIRTKKPTINCTTNSYKGDITSEPLKTGLPMFSVN